MPNKVCARMLDVNRLRKSGAFRNTAAAGENVVQAGCCQRCRDLHEVKTETFSRESGTADRTGKWVQGEVGKSHVGKEPVGRVIHVVSQCEVEAECCGKHVKC